MSEGKIHFKIKMMNKDFDINVDKDLTVLQVKEVIKKEINVEASDLKLIHKGMEFSIIDSKVRL